MHPPSSKASPAVTITTIFMMIIPLLGTRTGRPGGAPIPLCLCKTPAFAIPLPAQSPGEWLPDCLSPQPLERFKSNRKDQDSGIRIGAPTMDRPRQGGSHCNAAAGAEDAPARVAEPTGVEPASVLCDVEGRVRMAAAQPGSSMCKRPASVCQPGGLFVLGSVERSGI